MSVSNQLINTQHDSEIQVPLTLEDREEEIDLENRKRNEFKCDECEKVFFQFSTGNL